MSDFRSNLLELEQDYEVDFSHEVNYIPSPLQSENSSQRSFEQEIEASETKDSKVRPTWDTWEQDSLGCPEQDPLSNELEQWNFNGGEEGNFDFEENEDVQRHYNVGEEYGNFEGEMEFEY